MIVRALKEETTPKRSRTGSAGCSRRRSWRRGCTASSPLMGLGGSTRTRSSSSTHPTCRSPTRGRWSISRRSGTAAGARWTTTPATGAAWRSLAKAGGRRPVPLHFRLWSADSPKERYVRSWKRKWMCDELAWECRMRYREVVEGYITRWRAEDTNPPRQAVLRAGGHAPV